jgi:hypothetical protein
MQDPKNKARIVPGLEEAIHPEIGNGTAWETDPHSALLRSVDPLKSLELLLFEGLPAPSLSPEGQNDLTEIIHPDELQETIPEDPHLSQPGDISSRSGDPLEITAKSGAEQKSKADSGKKKKKQPEKAGKLVRKAAKREEKKQELAAEKSELPPGPQIDTLSPFTQWLKGLRGSEYVHPYGDDFAIMQTEGPGREGISATYAEVLAAQGYREQAIEMYRRLMEKFPEKSRFFAAKIEALQ